MPSPEEWGVGSEQWADSAENFVFAFFCSDNPAAVGYHSVGDSGEWKVGIEEWRGLNLGLGAVLGIDLGLGAVLGIDLGLGLVLVLEIDSEKNICQLCPALHFPLLGEKQSIIESKPIYCV